MDREGFNTLENSGTISPGGQCFFQNAPEGEGEEYVPQVSGG